MFLEFLKASVTASTCSTISRQVSRDRGLDLILHHVTVCALGILGALALCGMVCLRPTRTQSDAAPSSPTAANAAPSSPTQSDAAIALQ